MRIKLKILSLIVFVICFSILFIPSSRAGSDDYDLGFDENTLDFDLPKYISSVIKVIGSAS